MDATGNEHLKDLSSEPNYYGLDNANVERHQEWLTESCEAFFREVEGNCLFTSDDRPEIVRRLEEEEAEYTSSKDKRKQLNFPKRCNIQRSRWLSSKRIIHPGH